MAITNNYAPTTAYPSDSNLVYAENFFKHLQAIENNPSFIPTVLKVDTSEPRIKVLLNSRKIDIENSEYNGFLALRKDQRATTVYFEVDRYFEDVDLQNCTCVVQYMNMGAPQGFAKLRMYPITLRDTESLEKEGKMILAWCLGNEATEYSGDLIFSLIFYSINDTGTAFKYALHTLPAVGIILPGMVYTDQQEQQQDQFLEVELSEAKENNYITLLEMIRNKNVLWIDV